MTAPQRVRDAGHRAADAARHAVPALITGDAPAGVVTYTVVGATTGLTHRNPRWKNVVGVLTALAALAADFAALLT